MSDETPPDASRDKPKAGLFQRLFGRGEASTEAAHETPPAEPQASEGHPAEVPPPAQTDAAPDAAAASRAMKALFGESPIEEAIASETAAIESAGMVSAGIVSLGLSSELEALDIDAVALEGTQTPKPAEPETAAPSHGAGGFFRRVLGLGESEPATPEPQPEAPTEPKRNWWSRLREGLARSSGSIGSGLTDLFTKRKLDDAMLEDLEDILIRSDLGVATALRITKAVGKGRYDKTVDVEEVKAILASEVEDVLAPYAQPLTINEAHKPFVILIVGVNGSGKTTTIGKLALKFTQEGKKVMLAAGDTFRAAAIEQLRIWGERLHCSVIAREQGSDASGLAFDAIKAAQAEGSDILLMDTAGRLQNKAELMAELEKIIRVIKKVDESAPHAVLLVLDATVGQNAMAQVEVFGRVAGVTGLVMTKLDGTARGGILVAVAEKFKLPVHFIGVGETAEDLEPFEARDFARAIAGIEE